MYYQRDIENYIKTASNHFEAVVIYGARQVGKSTTVRHLFSKEFANVTLDDPDELDLARSNPKGFLDIHPWPLLIDEVQKAPILLNLIKKKIDEQREDVLKGVASKKLMYVLTGSNRFELQEGVAESLAGRAAVIEMNSFTQMEAQGIQGSLFRPDIGSLLEKEKSKKVPFAGQTAIFERIFRGGMPGIVADGTPREIFFKSYLETYLEKDVRKLLSASSEMTFRRFLSYLALRTGQQVNYEVFAREIGIDSATVKRWMSILETSGIIMFLEPYMASLSKRIIKAPKLYFMDTGLCAYLCKWPNAEMLSDCAMAGAFFETFVVSEIAKSFCNFGQNPKNTLFYYRDIDQKEIDLIYEEPDGIYPIEIKKGFFPSKPTKNFNVLEKYQIKAKPGLVISNTDKIRPINDSSYSLPVYLLGA